MKDVRVDRILVLLNDYSTFQTSVNPDFFQRYASSTYTQMGCVFWLKATKFKMSLKSKMCHLAIYHENLSSLNFEVVYPQIMSVLYFKYLTVETI